MIFRLGFMISLFGGKRRKQGGVGEGETAPKAQPAPAQRAPSRHMLHLSIGPVQGFIAEGRRTRDLWAGSFLLSWLVGRAIWEIEHAGGEILFPDLTGNALYAAIKSQAPSGGGRGEGFSDDVWSGGLPNHVRARVDASFDPNVCARAVHAAWRALTEEVWDAFFANANCPSFVKEAAQQIWARQIGTDTDIVSPFWDVVWVMAPDPGDGSDLDWIDLRKFTRLPKPAYGGEGRMCSLMAGLEELGGRLSRGESRDFWMAVQRGISTYLYGVERTQLELRASERLCAIAAVKRLFPLLKPEQCARAFRWPAQSGDMLRVWPSTAHVAAAPWLLRAGACAETELEHFAASVERLSTPSRVAERNCQVAPLRGVAWAEVDARLFHAVSARAFAFDELSSPDVAREAFAALQSIREKKDAAGETLGAPSPYYAIVAADGDEMGKHVRADAGGVLPALLKRFAASARAAFLRHGGVPIYAGGDDAFGLAPVDSALDIACALRQGWSETMAGAPAPPPTLSVAVAFVHHKHVLRWGVSAAKSLLDDVAKSVLERDALAIGLLRAGESGDVWGAKWALPVAHAQEASTPVDALRLLLEDAAGANALTYRLLRTMPWAWSSAPLPEALRAFENERSMPPMRDAALAEVIAAAGGCSPRMAQLIVAAGRIKPSNDDAPLSAALLALMRFIELHRQPKPNAAADRREENYEPSH